MRCLVVLFLLCMTLAMPGHVVAQADAASDPEAAGLIGDHRWESPQFGTRVRWTDDWTVLTEADATRSDPASGVDTITIGSDTTLLAVSVIAADMDAGDYMGLFLDELEMSIDDLDITDTGVIDDVAYGQYSGVLGNEPFDSLAEASVIDDDEGLMLLVVLTTPPGENADGLEQALADIKIDRELPFLIWTLDDES